MTPDELHLHEDSAVTFLNAQRLDDIEGRYAFHNTRPADVKLLIQAVRGLHRNRQKLETEIAELKAEIVSCRTIAANARLRGGR